MDKLIDTNFLVFIGMPALFMAFVVVHGIYEHIELAARAKANKLQLEKDELELARLLAAKKELEVIRVYLFKCKYHKERA